MQLAGYAKGMVIMIKMKKMMKRCLAAGLAAVCLISALPAGNMTVRAEEADSDTINLRFIVTSDIHGQMMSTDYESGRKNVHAGLEKLLTGIEEARVEVQEDNSFTFDLGDILFDYTTENIFTADSTAKQPIWDAYKQMGYDAFTLGNHDFDYGFSYIADQLFQAGLTSKCVVSNLWKTSSGEYPFRDSMMIQKLVTAEDGTEVLIKVGIVGETIPVLSQKTEVMTGQLTTEDIVKNASRKAKELKEDGADLVIVLAHSGFGTEEPEEMDGNVAYALTKIPEVDVVFAGHEHKTFPNGDGDAIVYSLPETDPQTALVNGKNLVMPGSRADQFGVVDLKCVLQDEELVIRDRSSEVRTVDALTTVSAYGITEELYGGFLDMFQEHNTKTIATIADGMTYHNYFGMIQDNAALQLVNDAKLAYAMKYQNSLKGSKYAGLPVVAASGYSYYGQNQDSDYVSVHTGADSSNYINLSGKLTGADITSLQIYHAYIVLYQVTGKQLREYMEWPASAYATIGEEEEGWNYLLPALIAPEWKMTGVISEYSTAWNTR